MRGTILKRSGVIPDPVPIKRTAKMRRRDRSEREVQKHCVCGLELKTRRGETRCPDHGSLWSGAYWQRTNFEHWPSIYQIILGK